MQAAETHWETDNYRWSPWTATEGIDAYIRRRRAAGWIYEGQVKEQGATVVLRFKRRHGQHGSIFDDTAAVDPEPAP